MNKEFQSTVHTLDNNSKQKYEILDKINSLEDFKKIDKKEYSKLASEIRNFLVDNVSKTGGHLAPNLGVVELTIALHSVFNSPDDKIIFDVGHQCYVHKILTGRKNEFSTLRKYNGLSGFPKNYESIHDVFNTGHSSTSIASALGIATANKLNKNNNYAIAVIGDGALTGGLAFEALNNAKIDDTNLIVILNDNQMSISPSVGNLSSYLNSVRSNHLYTKGKKDIRNFLKHIPLIGKPISHMLETIKDAFRHLILPNSVMFEQFGFTYLGPIDGHDINDLIRILSRAKNVKKPVLVHVVTQKGKGYTPAEENPDVFHGVGKFDKDTGKISPSNDSSYSSCFGKELVNLANKNDKIVAITAAMPKGTGLKEFSKKFPDRFFDVGIAEEFAVTFAAGLASQGCIPFFAIYSTFLQRSYDQILHDVALQNSHVIFAIDRAGIVGADGETHQGIYDLSFLSHIPNIVIMAPKDGMELREMMQFAVNYNSPVAIRYPRDSYVEKIDISKISKNKKEDNSSNYKNSLNNFKAEILKEGTDISLLCFGKTVQTGLLVSEKLMHKKINAELINCRFLKPLDEETIINSIKKTKNFITIEDNIINGGLASRLQELLANKDLEINYKRFFAYPDKFIKHGNTSDIEKEFGMDAESIAKTIQKELKKSNYLKKIK